MYNIDSYMYHCMRIVTYTCTIITEDYCHVQPVFYWDNGHVVVNALVQCVVGQ